MRNLMISQPYAVQASPRSLLDPGFSIHALTLHRFIAPRFWFQLLPPSRERSFYAIRAPVVSPAQERLAFLVALENSFG